MSVFPKLRGEAKDVAEADSNPRAAKRANLARVKRARKMLAQYKDTDKAANLADALADLMHWAQAEGIDFPAEVFRASGHFHCEQSYARTD